MNFKQLFETQRNLDFKIRQEKDLLGVDTLQEKILAVYVELGELANELPQTFKFWSNKENDYDNALVEYVDCLHFLLSIGNDIDYRTYTAIKPTKRNTRVLDEFLLIFDDIDIFKNALSIKSLTAGGINNLHDTYIMLFNDFLNLGNLLGFTFEEIETTYYSKNRINHERQHAGYW